MSALIRVVSSSQSASIQPGEKTEVTLTIQNFSEIVDRYQVAVDGVDPSWVSISRTEVSLFPKDQDQVRITLQPPAGTEARAGSYDLRIQVTSQENPAERTTTAFALVIGAQATLDVAIRPQKQSSLKQGVFTLQMANAGNTDLTLQLSATDPEEGCIYTFTPPQVRVPAGQSQVVQLLVQPKAPLTGKTTKTFSFTVTARPAGDPKLARQVQGQWEQLAPKRRRIWPFVVAGAVALVAIAAVAIALAWPKIEERRKGGGPGPTTSSTTDPMTVDADRDGLTLAEEKVKGTDPNNPDTDGDGLRDGADPDPLKPEGPGPGTTDSDGDGLPDSDEARVGTDPNNPDTDGDGLNDRAEVNARTDPLNVDTDGDGLWDGADTDPLVPQGPTGDTTPPGVQIRAEPASPTTDNQVTFTAEAWDETALASITILVNGNLAATCYSSPCVYSGGPYPEGSVSFSATAVDQAQNKGWTGDNYLTVAAYVPSSFDFDVFPDGTPIYGPTLLGGGEFSAWGFYVSAAPEGGYCSNAQAAIRYDISCDCYNLSAAAPDNMDACNGVPVRIQFATPVRAVTIRFLGASTDYQLNVFDQSGSWLGGATQQGELGQLREVSYRLDSPIISAVVFGHQAAMTAIVEIIIVR